MGRVGPISATCTSTPLLCHVVAAAMVAASMMTLFPQASQLWLVSSTVGADAMQDLTSDGHLHVDAAALP